jgi:DNA-binding transcriptional regulator YiaG
MEFANRRGPSAADPRQCQRVEGHRRQAHAGNTGSQRRHTHRNRQREALRENHGMDGLARMTEGFHYTDCGLDYVYLTSGYTIHQTDHGTGVSVKDARQLHERLALDILGRPYPLRGQEVRFLRAMLKLSQEALARVLGQRRGSFAHWEAESDKAIPGAADSARRMFYALKTGAHETATRVIHLLQALDEREHGVHGLRDIQLKNDGDWTRAAA